MGDTIGEILPLAVGIAISPIPIIAAILMLLSPKAKGTSLGFLFGWLVGIIAAIVIFTLLSSVLPQPADGPSTVAGVIKIVLGALLLLLAVKQWRSRPGEGEQAALPNWMAAIDTMTPAKALVLGFLLAAVNPKNLLMAASAGLVVGGASITPGQTNNRRHRCIHGHRRIHRPGSRHRLPGSLGQDGRAAGATSRMAGRQQRRHHGGASPGDRVSVVGKGIASL